jgi:hypothetical protein
LERFNRNSACFLFKSKGLRVELRDPLCRNLFIESRLEGIMWGSSIVLSSFVQDVSGVDLGHRGEVPGWTRKNLGDISDHRLRKGSLAFEQPLSLGFEED